MELEEETFSFLMESLMEKIARRIDTVSLRLDTIADEQVDLTRQNIEMYKKVDKIIYFIEDREEKDKSRFSPSL